MRTALAAVLVVTLAVGAYLVWPNRAGHKVTAYFSTAVGLYPGDDVRIVGVPVGTIDKIEPRAGDVKLGTHFINENQYEVDPALENASVTCAMP